MSSTHAYLLILSIFSVHQVTIMASYLLLFAGVLSALIGSGHSLSCVECKDGSESCTGPVRTCPDPNQICMSVYAVTFYGGISLSRLFIRECGNPAACDRSGSFSIPNGQVLTSTSCCYSDGCTPEKPVLPQVSNEKNGVRCKTCVSTTDESCETSEYMECTGKEVKCFKQVQTSIGSSGTVKSSYRGCATELYCNVYGSKLSIGDLTIIADSTCTSGCTSLRFSLSLLLLTVNLIMRVLY